MVNEDPLKRLNEDESENIPDEVEELEDTDISELEEEEDYEPGYLIIEQNSKENINREKDPIGYLTQKIKEIDENQEQLAWAITITQEQATVHSNTIQEIAETTTKINKLIQQGLGDQEAYNILDIDYDEIKKRAADDVLSKVNDKFSDTKSEITKQIKKKLKSLYIIIFLLLFVNMVTVFYFFKYTNTSFSPLNDEERLLKVTKTLEKGQLVYCGNSNIPIPVKGGDVTGYISDEKFFFYFNSGDKQIKCALKPLN